MMNALRNFGKRGLPVFFVKVEKGTPFRPRPSAAGLLAGQIGRKMNSTLTKNRENRAWPLLLSRLAKSFALHMAHKKGTA